MDPSSFQGCVAAAQGGDRDTFERLFSPHLGPLRNLIERISGARIKRTVEVDDLLQETLCRAWQSMPQFRGQDQASFWGWLSAIASHTVHDAARHMSARPETVGLPDRLPLADVRSPSRIVQEKERLQRLKSALRSLRPRHREVILLVFIKELPVKEAAAMMGLTPNAASMLLYRALMKLKATFGSTDSYRLTLGSLEEDGN